MTGWLGAAGPESDWHKPAERRDASGPPTSRSHGLHQFIRCAKLNLPGGRRDVKSSRRPCVGPAFKEAMSLGKLGEPPSQTAALGEFVTEAG